MSDKTGNWVFAFGMVVLLGVVVCLMTYIIRNEVIRADAISAGGFEHAGKTYHVIEAPGHRVVGGKIVKIEKPEIPETSD